MFGANNLNTILGLGVSVFLRDDFTRTASKVATSFNNLSANVQGKITNQLNQIQLLGAATALAGLGVARSLQNATKQTALFEETLYKTSAVVGGTAPELEAMRETLKSLSMEMSFRFPYAAGEISSAFFELSKAGIAAKDMKKMTEAVLAFGTAADIGLGGEEGAANMLLNIMAGYGIQIKDAMSVADMMSKAANITTVNPSQIYESLKYSQDTLHNFNVGLAESISLIAAMGQAGLKDSRAGIALQNMFTFLNQAIGPKMTKTDKMAWSMLGIDPESVKTMLNEGAGMAAILGLIRDRMTGLSPSDQQFIMSELTGVRGGRGASAEMRFLRKQDVEGRPAKTFADIKNQTLGAYGEAMKIVNERMKSPEQQLQAWNKSLFFLRTAIVDNIFPVLLPMINVMAKGFKLLGDVLRTPYLGKALTWFGIAAMGLVTLAGGIAAIMASLALLKMSGMSTVFGMGGIVTVFQMLWSNLKGVFVYFNAAGRLVGPLGRTVALWSTGLKAMMPGMVRFVGLLGPWALGIIGLTAALYGLYNYSDKIRIFMDDTGTWILNFFKTIGAGVRYLDDVLSALSPSSPITLAGANARLRRDYNEIWAPSKGTNTVTQPKEYTPVIRFKNSEGKTDAQMEKLLSMASRPINITLVTPDGKQVFKKYVDGDQAMDLYHNLGLKT